MKQLSFINARFSATNFPKIFLFAVFILLIIHCSLRDASAQQDEQQGTAPPPMKVISKEEDRQLNAENDLKKRTKLALDFMEIRLKKAEDLNAQQNYTEMFNELGAFNALIDRTLEFLNRSDTGGNKSFYNFKRVEITLREFLPRLEVIRRELPVRYEFYVRTVAKNVRTARSKAIDPLFGNTVIRDNEKN